jgi:hemolysin activation/secretion protein
VRAIGVAMTLAACPALAWAAPDGAVSSVDPTAVVQKPADRSQPITTPSPAPATVGADTKARFTLTAIRIDGAKALPASALDSAWVAQRGQPVSIADLTLIARRIEGIYAIHGYPFVAVLVTAQRVEGGVVHLKVIEGRISAVAILSTDPVARRQVGAAFAPLVDRQPLSQADLEGAYQRAKSVPGIAISGALRRGDSEGSMDLVVQAKRQEWRTYANINNLYPETVGPWGALVGVDHFGGSAYGDQASLQLYSALDGGSQYVVRGSYDRALNAKGTTLSLLALGAHAEPGRQVAPLDLATNVALGKVGLLQPLISGLNSQVSLSGSFEVNNQQTKVFSSVGLTRDRLRVLSIILQGQMRLGNGGGLAGSVEYRQGVDAFGASRSGDLGLSRLGADPEARVGRLTLEAQSPAVHTVRLFGHLDGQIASGALTAPEQYVFGNLSIGRGYQPGAAFGDNALAGRIEVRFGPYPVAAQFSVAPFVFADEAELWTLVPGAHARRDLGSYGGGLRLEAPHQTHLELIYAVPQDPPLGLGEGTPHPRLLLNLTFGLNDAFSIFRSHPAGGATR